MREQCSADVVIAHCEHNRGAKTTMTMHHPLRCVAGGMSSAARMSVAAQKQP
jgi:hypothetical protein